MMDPAIAELRKTRPADYHYILTRTSNRLPRGDQSHVVARSPRGSTKPAIIEGGRISSLKNSATANKNAPASAANACRARPHPTTERIETMLHPPAFTVQLYTRQLTEKHGQIAGATARIEKAAAILIAGDVTRDGSQFFVASSKGDGTGYHVGSGCECADYANGAADRQPSLL